LIIWLVAMFFEVVQMLGYVSNGLARRYLTSGRHWFDFVVVLLTGAVSIALLRLKEDSSKEPNFCTALGVLVLCKWMRFLIYLRQIKAIGIQILPITQAMWDIVPFLIVLSIYLLATVNMFFALNNGHSFGDCFLLIYRLVVLGEADVSELENQDAPQVTVDLMTGDVVQSDSARTSNFIVVRIMMVVASFVIGVSLMNLFLAMLCVSYDAAHRAADLSFMRSRARIVLDQHAVRVGLARFLSCFQKQPSEIAEKIVFGGRKGSDFDCSRSVSVKSAQSANMVSHKPTSVFLWFAKPTEF